jgi:outer membrane receptor for ferric coprogen and ferric-rhodotorulic acid
MPLLCRVPLFARIPSALLSSLLVGLALAVPVVGQPAHSASAPVPDVARAVDVAPGALAQVLTEYASQAGVALTFDARLLGARQSSGLQGRYTPQQGFDVLLASGLLEAVLGPSGGYVVRERPASGAAEPAQLAPITVTGASATTEGSRSYTARETAGATGLALSPRETPQSVSVITRQFMDDQGLQSLVDVLHTAPGVTVTQLDSERYSFYARGFAIENIQYDGIPGSYQGSGDSEMDPIFYDRIEVVRGATGLMSGAGQPSASINLVRKRAIHDTLTGELSASAGSWGNRRASVDVSVPLAAEGHVRGRLVAAHEDKDSFIDGYSRRRSTVYGVVDADLNDATTVSVGASYQKTDVQGATYGGLPFWYTDGSPIDWRSQGRSFSIWPRWSTEQVESHSVFANLDHHFANGWVAHVAANYREQDLAFQRLFAWGFPDAQSGLMSANPSRVQFPAVSRQRGIDAKLSGPFTWAGRRHEAVVGVGYSHEDRTTLRRGAADAPAQLSLFDWENYPEPSAWGPAVLSEAYSRRQAGVYGALRLSISDPFTVILGTRYNRWDRSGAGYMGAAAYDYEKKKLTPYMGVVYDLNDRWSAYASYTSIFNPQNYRTRTGAFLEPLKGNSYETGIKGEFFNGALNGALALFQARQDNVAQLDPGQIVPGTTTRAYVGMEGVKTRGIELDMSGEPHPGWNLAFNVTHFRATDATGADAATASPRTVARLFTAYRLPGAWNALTVGGGINWQSRVHNPTGVYHDDAPTGQGSYEQRAYVLVNLMARYDVTKQLSVQVNVNNVFDKWYQSAVNFNEQLVWGAPRNVQATLRYRF